MSHRAAASLRSHLIRRLLPLQAVLLAALAMLLLGTLWMTGFLQKRDEERVIDIVQRALARDGDGRLVLRPTAELQRLRLDMPSLWFLIRDKEGNTLGEGQIPPEFAKAAPALEDVGHAKLGWDREHDRTRRLTARMKRVDTEAGNMQIIATGEGQASDGRSAIYIGLMFLALTIPCAILMALATLVATPFVVRNALAGLDQAAAEARKIDINKRGTRLPLETVPVEIVPLVGAMNDALGRIDEGYERHKRFLADAAHELRTPIAILTTRLESLPQGTEQKRLLEDVTRLATLTEQLLDLQRLEHHLTPWGSIDLVAISRQVVADLAPMAISAGYKIALQHQSEHVEVMGDQSAIQRALLNLVQNAIQHGGRHGTIIVSVRSPATIEVSDQGPGIPESQREQIFEPFHRLQPQMRGVGLGLNLVREIMRLHHGEISVVAGLGCGACFRMSMPASATVRNSS